MSYSASLLLAVVAAITLGACSRSPDAPQGRQGQAQPPAVPVTVARAVEKPVPIQARAIGNVVPTATVTVRARAGGVLRRIHFSEGEMVKEGQVLFTVDRATLEADLRQAQANLAKSTAQLENARKEAERYKKLLEQGLVSQSQYEQLATNAAALAATVNADAAAVQNARLQLGYATVTAPMSGRTGAVLVHEGDLIQANQTAMVVINRIRPIDVQFSLPERQLADVQRYQAHGPLSVEATAPQGARALAEGALTFVDNRVDPATGTIQLKATFANDDGQLWPGQFVEVVMTLTVQPSAIVVPSAAVQTGQDGRHVYVVKPDGTAELRAVQVARELGPETVIAQGVKPGEPVITEGQLRVTPGARVEPRTSTAESLPQPAASPQLAPANR